MTQSPRPELRAYERPVRSDPGLDRVYARRRRITLAVLLAAMLGGVYGIWGHDLWRPGEIPTIHAEGPYKQKPADPGGIDIPNQDMRVYDALDKQAAPPAVEHLLPLPEAPKDISHMTAMPPAPADQPHDQTTDATVDSALPPPAAPAPVTTTVAPPPAVVTPAASAPASKAAPPPTPAIDQVIEKTKAAATAASLPASVTGNAAIQLASVQNQAQAQQLMQTLKQKYAAQLGNVSLQLARADLGSRGIYYRIQSQALGADQADQICAALKHSNAGCILVRK